MAIIKRIELLKSIKIALKSFKVVALIGPRQVGKSTLAKQLAMSNKTHHFFDLEDPIDEKILSTPKLSLDDLEGLIIIDEIQRLPEIYPYLRVKADKLKKGSRILLLGSASRDLIEKASESLAGRILFIEVTPFSLTEVKASKQLFSRGGFPLSYLARNDSESYQWRKAYLQSLVERDLKLIGFDLPSQTVRRFLEMLTGYHGQIFNSSEIGKSLGISHTTARKYLDILKSAFLIRELKPWHSNIIQRQVKQPKVYFRDTGLLFYLLGLKNTDEINRHPRLGSFWESFALEEIIKNYNIDPNDIYFWALHQNGELDLLWINNNTKIGFEFKYTDKPGLTQSMLKSVELLKLDKLILVYPGTKSSKLNEKIYLQPLIKNT